MNRLLLAVMFIAVLMSGFGLERIADRTEPPGRIHVSYWEKWTGFEFDAMQSVVDDFNRSQSRIQVDFVPISDIGNKTLFAVSAGCPPDVAGLWGDDVAHYADERSITPLDDLCRQNGVSRTDYIPAYWKLVTYAGHVWALPSTPTSSALNYNWALFRAAGLDPAKPPRTLEELARISDKLTIMKNGHLVRAGFLPAEPGDWNWGWGYLFGGRLWDGVSKITADSPENVKAFTWVQSFSKKFGPGESESFKSGFGNFASPQNSFVEGQVVMELQGVWTHNFVNRFDPSMKLGVAPFPYPQDRPDLAGSTFVGSDILVIPRGAPHTKEAFEFIRFVQTQPEMEKLCIGQEKNSPLIKVSKQFWNTHKNPDIRLYQTLPTGHNPIAMPQMGIWPEFASAMDNAFEEVSLMSKTPQAALQDVQTRMQPKLDQYMERMNRRRREGW